MTWGISFLFGAEINHHEGMYLAELLDIWEGDKEKERERERGFTTIGEDILPHIIFNQTIGKQGVCSNKMWGSRKHGGKPFGMNSK